jgi:hypothetical protein
MIPMSVVLARMRACKMGHKENRGSRRPLPLPPASEEALAALWRLGACTRDDLAHALDGSSAGNKRRRAASLLATLQRRGLATLRPGDDGGRFVLTPEGAKAAKRLVNVV